MAGEERVKRPAYDREVGERGVRGDVEAHADERGARGAGLDRLVDQEPAGPQAVGQVSAGNPGQHAVDAKAEGAEADEPVGDALDTLGVLPGAVGALRVMNF